MGNCVGNPVGNPVENPVQNLLKALLRTLLRTGGNPAEGSPVLPRTFTMAEDPKLPAVGEKHVHVRFLCL